MHFAKSQSKSKNPYSCILSASSNTFKVQGHDNLVGCFQAMLTQVLLNCRAVMLIREQHCALIDINNLQLSINHLVRLNVVCAVAVDNNFLTDVEHGVGLANNNDEWLCFHIFGVGRCGASDYNEVDVIRLLLALLIIALLLIIIAFLCFLNFLCQISHN